MSYHNFSENFAQTTPLTPSPTPTTPSATPQSTVPGITTGTPVSSIASPISVQQLMTGMPLAPGDYDAASLASILTSRSSNQTNSAVQAVILFVIFGSVIGIMYMFFNLFKI